MLLAYSTLWKSSNSTKIWGKRSIWLRPISPWQFQIPETQISGTISVTKQYIELVPLWPNYLLIFQDVPRSRLWFCNYLMPQIFTFFLAKFFASFNNKMFLLWLKIRIIPFQIFEPKLNAKRVGLTYFSTRFFASG